MVVRIWYAVNLRLCNTNWTWNICVSSHTSKFKSLINESKPFIAILIPLHSILLLYLIWKGYFRFPFYGHEVDKVYVTTDGFLSLSSRIHGFIYKIQYIAPLRLKLDPSLSEESEISYKLTENNLTVEWKRMKLQNALSKKQEDTTFQVRDFMEILSRHLKNS